MDAHIAGKHQPMVETIVETRVSELVEALGGVWERVETHVKIRREWGMGGRTAFRSLQRMSGRPAEPVGHVGSG